MNRKKILTLVSSTAIATVLLGATNVAQAWNMGNMMNPGEWFDDDDDDHSPRGRADQSFNQWLDARDRWRRGD